MVSPVTIFFSRLHSAFLHPWWQVGQTMVASVILAVSMFFIGEWYPFSDFPMYARLGGERWTVQLCDAEGKVIPCLTELSLPTSNIKKIVDKNLLALKKKHSSKRKGLLPFSAWEESGRKALSYVAERVQHQGRVTDAMTMMRQVSSLKNG
jgi:hypothetical protein